MMMYGEAFYGPHTAQHQLQQSKIKAKKETKNTQNHENRSLGLIEPLYM